MNRWLAAVSGVLAGSCIAVAEPVVTQRVDHYDVAGTIASDIRADLNRLRPTDRSGERHDAHTRWSVKWQYKYSSTPQGCSIASVTTSVDTTITLPRLKPDASMPVALVRAFADYLDKLFLHEQGHAQNALDIARRIETGVRALPSQSSCDALGRAANALGNDLIKQGNQLDVEYDARTQHGRTQGARFP